jgi:hypothetical protein
MDRYAAIRSTGKQEITPVKYSLRSLMTFSIRDLFWLTLVVALAVAWWMDRLNSRRELQGVQLRLALEEDNNKHLKFRAKVLADSAAIRDAAAKEYYERDVILRAAADEISSAPAPNPPKKLKSEQVHLIAHNPSV